MKKKYGPAGPAHPSSPSTRCPLLCRLSTVRRADMIVVVQDGQAVERGTHEELLQRPGGRYAQLVNTAELGAYWVHSGASDSSSSSSSDEDEQAPAAAAAAGTAA